MCVVLQPQVRSTGSSKTQCCPESDDVHEDDVADCQWQHRVTGASYIDDV